MTVRSFLCLLGVLSLLVPGLQDARGASKRPVRAKHGMVSSAEPHASQVGVEILRAGGNAVDAAVAVGFALAVTFPQAGNIGGGGFMLIRLQDGTTTCIDYREMAPHAATRDMYLDTSGVFVPERSLKGPLAAGVPGSVAGLLLALHHYGTMKREEVLAPAIRLAEEGFEVRRGLSEDLRADSLLLGAFPASRSIFLRNGDFYKEGDTLVQRDLGATLQLIADRGSDGFYRGRTASLIVKEIKRGGGLISEEDLASYRAIERPPVRGSYRGFEVLSASPPSSGGVALLEMLNILEGYNLKSSGYGASRNVALMVDAMQIAYADRAEFLGDPDFFAVPSAELTSKAYAALRRAAIDTNSATPSTAVGHGDISVKESNHTTHYSVIDQWGNVVSVTTTINSYFGCGVTVEGAGFLLNNEKDDFSAKPGVPNQYGLLGSEANAIAPGKRMLSSMTPTILVRDAHPYLVVGSPGGATIITTVLQVILNVVDYGMGIQEAVDAPRIHYQWYPDTLVYERFALPLDVRVNLEQRGYHLKERFGTQGWVEAILVDPMNGFYLGASDSRGDGASVGY